jgi:hypothetical protein
MAYGYRQNRYFNSRYATSQPTAYASGAADVRRTSSSPASDKQIAFLTTLLAERELGSEIRAALVQEIADGTINKTQASWGIEQALAAPRKASVTLAGTPAPPAVPDGRYAITSDGETQARFYRVNSPKDGKWAGLTFVSEVKGGATSWGNERSIRDAAERTSVLNAIAADPQTAMANYGHLTNKCGKCHALLTDEVSVAQGIGPICIGTLGWTPRA